SEFKKLLNTIRRYILPILFYFDRYLLIREGN
ncbi:MAG: SelB C-terminal domain-containing protein, partial [Fidelibacterota bacterium]